MAGQAEDRGCAGETNDDRFSRFQGDPVYKNARIAKGGNSLFPQITHPYRAAARKEDDIVFVDRFLHGRKKPVFPVGNNPVKD